MPFSQGEFFAPVSKLHMPHESEFRSDTPAFPSDMSSKTWDKESYPLVTAIQSCVQFLASLLYPAAQMRPVEGQNSNSITR